MVLRLIVWRLTVIIPSEINTRTPRRIECIVHVSPKPTEMVFCSQFFLSPLFTLIFAIFLLNLIAVGSLFYSLLILYRRLIELTWRRIIIINIKSHAGYSCYRPLVRNQYYYISACNENCRTNCSPINSKNLKIFNCGRTLLYWCGACRQQSAVEWENQQQNATLYFGIDILLSRKLSIQMNEFCFLCYLQFRIWILQTMQTILKNRTESIQFEARDAHFFLEFISPISIQMDGSLCIQHTRPFKRFFLSWIDHKKIWQTKIESRKRDWMHLTIIYSADNTLVLFGIMKYKQSNEKKKQTNKQTAQTNDQLQKKRRQRVNTHIHTQMHFRSTKLFPLHIYISPVWSEWKGLLQQIPYNVP